MKQALSGAFDMLSHSMETYFGAPHDNNLSDLIAEANMRCVIDNTRKMIAAPEDLVPRSELFWASAMAENGILKIGKQTAFQAHMIEHQLGAYTDCNHGFGLAVIHPTMYRHMMSGVPEKFARFAAAVWGIDADGRTTEELAAAGSAPRDGPPHGSRHRGGPSHGGVPLRTAFRRGLSAMAPPTKLFACTNRSTPAPRTVVCLGGEHTTAPPRGRHGGHSWST